MEPPQAEEDKNATPDAQTPEVQAEAQAVEATDDQPEADDEKVTIEVDGKTVELSKAELADAYKNGLRQDDYTRKTMQVAEQRKAAETELARARVEREQYAGGLQQANAVLSAQLQERTADQWNDLAQTDPAKWVLERNLYEQRYSAYQQNQARLGELQKRSETDAQEAQRLHLSQQRENLLAKLPEWKDESKAQAEKSRIAKSLKDIGYDDSEIGALTDHRAVLLARKAMLYDELVSKAQAATKKVNAAPQKIVKPGVGERPNLDGRSNAMRQLAKTGSIDDAAKAWASIL